MECVLGKRSEQVPKRARPFQVCRYTLAFAPGIWKLVLDESHSRITDIWFLRQFTREEVKFRVSGGVA